MKLVSLRVSVIAILIGLSSCSPPSAKSAECNVSEVWNKTFENYVDTDVFVDVTVNEDSYDVLGIIYQNEASLGDEVRRRSAYYVSQNYVPGQMVVRSDPTVSCQRFRKAIKIIERNYPCDKPNLCFAAYGLGKNFLPSNIAPPPPEVPNR